MESELLALGAELAGIAAKNGASAIQSRIKTIRTSKELDKRSSEYEEIINELLDEKSELTRIATAYKQELTAQQISEDDIRYISKNIMPLIEGLLPDNKGQVEILKSLLSKETLRILQLVGFNYRAAIGEPLTELVRNKISGTSKK